jgi:hypothetical protein
LKRLLGSAAMALGASLLIDAFFQIEAWACFSD